MGTFTRLAADRAALNHRLDDLDAKRARLVAAAEELNDLRAAIAEGIAEQEAEVAAIDAAVLAAAQDIVSHPAPSITPPVPSGPLRADWDAIAMCESGGNWHIDSTYDGGLQFHPDTWLGYGGGQYARYAWQATR